MEFKSAMKFEIAVIVDNIKHYRDGLIVTSARGISIPGLSAYDKVNYAIDEITFRNRFHNKDSEFKYWVKLQYAEKLGMELSDEGKHVGS